jgi:hypothetical protein
MTQCATLRREVVEPAGGLGSCSVVVDRATMVLLNVLTEAGVQLNAGGGKASEREGE